MRALLTIVVIVAAAAAAFYLFDARDDDGPRQAAAESEADGKWRPLPGAQPAPDEGDDAVATLEKKADALVNRVAEAVSAVVDAPPTATPPPPPAAEPVVRTAPEIAAGAAAEALREAPADAAPEQVVAAVAARVAAAVVEDNPRPEVAPAAEANPQIEVAPAAEANPQIEVAPVAETQSRIEVGPVAETQSRIEVGPVAETHPRLDVAAVSEAVADVVREALPDFDRRAVTDRVIGAVVERQAEKYLEKLARQDAPTLDLDRADHFVQKGQVVALLPEATIETLDRAALLAAAEVSPDAPITVVRTVEQIELATPERIIAESAGDLEHPVRVVEGDVVRETTAREILERFAREPGNPISTIREVRHFEVTTPAELADAERSTAAISFEIIRRPYRLESATLEELLRNEMKIHPDSLFYVRTVRPGDEQGIWGIVHQGLLENFARGVAIRRGERVDRYQVAIPRDADERHSDESSSFLGRLIFRKSRESYVYNFKINRMGRNPDRIFPGQEIVIVNFQPEELIAIYRHFVEKSG